MNIYWEQIRKLIPAFIIIVTMTLFTACGSSGGGSNNENDGGNTGNGAGAEEMETIIKLSDNTFIIVGGSESFSDNGKSDGLLIKMDADGNINWAKTYGGSEDDMLIDVKLANDGGLWVVGWTKSFGVENVDIWILRLDSQGNVIWSKTYGGSGIE